MREIAVMEITYSHQKNDALEICKICYSDLAVEWNKHILQSLVRLCVCSGFSICVPEEVISPVHKYVKTPSFCKNKIYPIAFLKMLEALHLTVVYSNTCWFPQVISQAPALGGGKWFPCSTASGNLVILASVECQQNLYHQITDCTSNYKGMKGFSYLEREREIACGCNFSP